MKQSVEKTIIFIFLIILMGISITGVVAYRNSVNYQSTTDWVELTQTVLFESEKVSSLAQNIVNGSRGYLLTADSSFLEPFTSSKETIFTSIRKLKELTKDSKTQQKRLDSLNTWLRKRIEYSNELIELRNKQGLTKAAETTALGEGKFYLDNIVATIADIQKEENEHLIKRKEESEKSISRFNFTFYALLVSVVILMGVFFFATWYYLARAAHTNKLLNRQIAERKKAESEAKETNIFLETVLENIPDMIFVKEGKELRFAKINKAEEEFLGIPRREMLNKNDYDFFPKDQADFFIAKDREVLTRGMMMEIPEEVITTVHGQRWLRTKKIPVMDSAGNPLYLLGISEDITETKIQKDRIRQFYNELEEKVKARTEELSKSERRFRALIENSADCITLVDETGQLLYQSPAVERTIGYNSEEISRRPRFSLVHPDDAEKLITHFLQLIKFPGASMPILIRVLHKNGQYIWIEGVITNLLFEEGVHAMVANYRDVTESKEAEGKLRTYAADLKSSNKDLEQFAYVASHDLQEPLRMVSSFLQLLEKRYQGQLDETAQEYIQFAVDGAERMKKLILDLLAYSRIGSSNDELVKTDMNEIVDVVKHTFSQNLKEAGGEIISENLPVVTAVRIQMLQLMQNLVGNAIKYCKGRPPKVEISYAENNGYWAFSVKDNGIGIDEQYFEKVFVIFQRLHSKSEYSGTGIGLAICKKIVERHGGSITVKSKEGDGSTFTFTLKNRMNEYG